MSIVQEIKKRLANLTVKITERSNGKLFIEISPEDIEIAAGILFGELNMRFITISGIDTRNNIEMLYHFSNDPTGEIITLRTFISSKSNPVINSLTGIFKAAEWIEREIHELLGVDFKGHPNLKHLLLNDEWPKGNYPLRHDNE